MFSKRVVLPLILLFAGVRSAPVEVPPGTNSTVALSPKYEPAWTSGPTRRGTLDILFSCVLTLVLCVWTTVHANIEPEMWHGSRSAPEVEVEAATSPTRIGTETDGFVPRSPKVVNTKPNIPAPSALNKKKLAWSLVTLLFPEITLFVAAHERKTVHLLQKEMHKISRYSPKENGWVWDRTLSYYALMGGFVVEQKAGALDPPLSTITENERPSFKENADGIDGTQSNMTGPHITHRASYLERRRTLTPQGVIYLASLKQLPHYTPQTVKDKSKASLLAKFLVCFQAIWMVIQVLGRYATHLPVTLLELYTILHTVCAVAMYLIWMDKPFDVTQPTFIPLSSEVLQVLANNLDESPSDLDEGYHHPTNIFWNHNYRECLTTRAGLGKLLFRQLLDWDRLKKGDIIDRFLLLLGAYKAMWNGWRSFGWEAFALSFVGVVHGGLHMVAWDYSFPSDAERRLWKIASVLTAGAVSIFCFSVLVGFLGKLVWDKVKKKMDEAELMATVEPVTGGDGIPKSTMRWHELAKWLETKRKALTWWLLVFYCIGFVLAIVPCILARLYLLVESFAAMRQLPIKSYDKIQWASFVPHFG